MYRIMIVDDEYFIRDGLLNAVEWNTIGAEAIGEAADGAEALRKMPELLPDVIISDICMADMDGLRFAEAVKEDWPQTRIIFLSGYDNFTYAQQAVKLKAFDYILKPGDPDKILAAVRAAILEIEEEREREKRIRSLEDSEEVGALASQKQFFQSLLRSRGGNPEQAGEQLERLGLLGEDVYFCAAILEMDGFYDRGLQEDAARLYEMLREAGRIASEYLPDASHGLCLYEDVQDFASLVLAIGIRKDQEKLWLSGLFYKIEQIKDAVAASQGVTCTIGMGDPVHTLPELYDSCQQARIAMQYQLTLGGNRVMRMKEIPSTSRYTYPHGGERQILDGLRGLDSSLTANGARSFLKELSEAGSTKAQIQTALSQLYAAAGRLFEKPLDLGGLYGGTRLDPHAIVESLSSMQALENYLITLLDDAVAIRREEETKNVSVIVSQVQGIIRGNYGNPDLSLSMIAEQLFLNTAYLSKLYKKEAGENYVEFMISYRLDKAKELLRCTNHAVGEVSVMVGYTNPQYFSTLFKKRFGLSPLEYREKHGKGIFSGDTGLS